ncbi:CDP-diacylglycerol/glycerol-3-phosphate 3-phosphatidyltransferase (plasmid) [Peptoclostridium acidaminophilum DSM 3953]|uniref:CDP-diacylglycerol--glycerol-3-phosphate 3-phosphatidyltransferase n=2 Tax=Peptoclostridium acidaminophilum TaxID=1731 RepID=W8UBA6_PEPAC|nr:CDP-diacylglycerol/glycerol-3-phosphate 3-phosphatidyltransferase [Peptoclostridium acidaminophilum DSM 3953]
MNMKNNIPNIITASRIPLAAIFVALFMDGRELQALIVLAFAGFTDLLDGFVARRLNLVSDTGKLLDPLSDKILAVSVLAALTIKGYVPLWVAAALAFKELLMIMLSSRLYAKNVVVQANMWGKLATFLIYVAVFSLFINKSVGTAVLYIALGASLVALIQYVLKYAKCFADRTE